MADAISSPAITSAVIFHAAASTIATPSSEQLVGRRRAAMSPRLMNSLRTFTCSGSVVVLSSANAASVLPGARGLFELAGIEAT